MRLNIIGAGVVGSVLGRLWSLSRSCDVVSIKNQTIQSALSSVERVGAGKAVQNLNDLPEADLLMISTSDDSLATVVKELAGMNLSRATVFHCSGSLGSDVLKTLNAKSIASLHPVKTFADFDSSVKSFAGTYCTIEGDKPAVEQLSVLIRQIQGVPIEIESDKKLLYHSGMVMISNYLAALIYSGQNLLCAAGISKENALNLIGPIARESLSNSLSLGPVVALTGPIQRGDTSVVIAEIKELSKADPEMCLAYKALGKIAVRMASERGLDSRLLLRLTASLE